MTVARVLSRAQLGLDAPLVNVEVHLGSGLPSFTIVGLPAPVVRESRERVRAAITSSGFEFPPGRITVNLAPVELAKEGGRFDLPIALGVLLASGQVKVPPELQFECFGELGLGGELKPVRGLFLAALHAARASHAVLAPRPNLAEIHLAGHRSVLGIEHLREINRLLSSSSRAGTGFQASAPAAMTEEQSAIADLSDVIGQERAKRALVVAAAGGHALLLIGPPGSGKSMLAARLPCLLPPLSAAEAIEVASIVSICSPQFDRHNWGIRPFRAPHHTASAQAIVGGGPRVQPGEISLAHRGVLFLDELPEFDRRVLESLREPLESGAITISRAAGYLELPAEFQLVAAMNPCPCGYFGDPVQPCRCTAQRIGRYREKISGPLLDRIDIRVEVPRVAAQELVPSGVQPATGEMAGRICQARALQWRRSGCVNARLSVRQLALCCALEVRAERLLSRSCDRLALSGRGMHCLLRVGRTIADLAGSESIRAEHLAEAIQLRRPLTLAAGFKPRDYFCASDTR